MANIDGRRVVGRCKKRDCQAAVDGSKLDFSPFLELEAIMGGERNERYTYPVAAKNRNIGVKRKIGVR